MTIRDIVYVGDDRLQQVAAPITEITPDLKQLATDMLETMRHHHGVGLAGPQIGLMARIFVAEIPASHSKPPHPQSGVTYVLLNPNVIAHADTFVEGEENCISISGWRGRLRRPEWIEIQAVDLAGQSVHHKVDDLLARVFWHEIDHLNGRLYTDRITGSDNLWQVENTGVDTTTH